MGTMNRNSVLEPVEPPEGHLGESFDDGLLVMPWELPRGFPGKLRQQDYLMPALPALRCVAIALLRATGRRLAGFLRAISPTGLKEKRRTAKECRSVHQLGTRARSDINGWRR